jgi:hypothetical protein
MKESTDYQRPIRYCTRCREGVPPERVAHGSPFCSDECRNADKRERRASKAGTNCRLCGRRFNRRKTKDAPSQPLPPAEPRATVAQQPQGCPSRPALTLFQENGHSRADPDLQRVTITRPV